MKNIVIVGAGGVRRGLFNNTTDKYVRANLELAWVYR